MRATTTTQHSQKRRRASPSITESDESMASAQTCQPNLSANSAPSQLMRRQILKKQQIKNKFIIFTIKNTSARSQDTQQSNFQLGPCSPNQPNPTQCCVSPNNEGPENSLTVREAEYASDSDAD